MNRLAVLAFFSILLTTAWAQETPPPSLKAERPFNIEEVGMLPIEREQIANHLAGVAVAEWLRYDAPSEELIRWTHRLLAFALVLHPGNPRALSTFRSLRQGKLPRALPEEVDAAVLAELLSNRSQLLIEQGGEANQQLAVYFLALAVRLAPYNEEVVYRYELNLLKELKPDWSLISSVFAE